MNLYIYLSKYLSSIYISIYYLPIIDPRPLDKDNRGDDRLHDLGGQPGSHHHHQAGHSHEEVEHLVAHPLNKLLRGRVHAP